MKPFLLIVVSMLLVLAGVVGADAPATQPTTQPFDKAAAAKLIDQLGDGNFDVRDAATKKLIALGDAVRPLLAEKAKEKGLEAEVSARIQMVIAALDLDPKHSPVFKGKVVDETGKPVANAWVYLAGDVADSTYNVEASTNADGTFVLRLPPGSKSFEGLVFAKARGTMVAGLPIKGKADETTDVGVITLAPIRKQ